jgi:membrane-associated phospholipid phosphatase
MNCGVAMVPVLQEPGPLVAKIMPKLDASSGRARHDPILDRLLKAFLLIVILAQAAFAAFPGIDLAVSRLFTDGQGVFWATLGPWPSINAAIKHVMECTAVLLVAGVMLGSVAGPLRGADLRCWCFAALNVVIAPGVIVNLVLKSHLGRARPAYVAEFGGASAFTPPFQVTDQCINNCSFTSGEVALATSLGICAVVLLWQRLSRLGRLAAVVLALAGVLIVAALRISLGRHFLSDAVFSVIVSVAVAMMLYRLLDLGRARTTFAPDAPVVWLRGRLEMGYNFCAAQLRYWSAM